MRKGLRGKKLQKIIYTSPQKIEWDAQSAFKVTNYYTDTEQHMVFCYLKQYVHAGQLKLCTFCFDSEATDKNDIQLCFNLNPAKQDGFVHMEFGIDGIDSVVFVNGGTKEIDSEGITFHSFKSNDQQGFYWCGEVTLSEQFIRTYFDTYLDEEGIILLNMYKIFAGSSDYACLFPDGKNDIPAKADSMQEFVILKY